MFCIYLSRLILMIGTFAAFAWSIASDGLRHHAVIRRHHQHHDIGGAERRGRAWR